MCEGHNAGEYKEIIVKERVKVDSCIANEVGWLNEHGVVTVSSCCGHGKNAGSILIKRSCSERARELGYNPKPYYLKPNNWWYSLRVKLASWIYGRNLSETFFAEIRPKGNMHEITYRIYGEKAIGEVCKRCFREHACGFNVPDNLWNIIVKNRYNVLCLTCFDELAAQEGIRWDDHAVELFPVSRVRNFGA